jgi:hypothetical protein
MVSNPWIAPRIPRTEWPALSRRPNEGGDVFFNCHTLVLEFGEIQQIQIMPIRRRAVLRSDLHIEIRFFLFSVNPSQPIEEFPRQDWWEDPSYRDIVQNTFPIQ